MFPNNVVSDTVINMDFKAVVPDVAFDVCLSTTIFFFDQLKCAEIFEHHPYKLTEAILAN